MGLGKNARSLPVAMLISPIMNMQTATSRCIDPTFLRMPASDSCLTLIPCLEVLPEASAPCFSPVTALCVHSIFDQMLVLEEERLLAPSSCRPLLELRVLRHKRPQRACSAFLLPDHHVLAEQEDSSVRLDYAWRQKSVQLRLTDGIVKAFKREGTNVSTVTAISASFIVWTARHQDAGALRAILLRPS